MTTPVTPHRISSVSFSRNECHCTCGAVTRATTESFRDHRYEMRAGPANLDVAHSHERLGATVYQTNINVPPQPERRGGPPDPR